MCSVVCCIVFVVVEQVLSHRQTIQSDFVLIFILNSDIILFELLCCLLVLFLRSFSVSDRYRFGVGWVAAATNKMSAHKRLHSIVSHLTTTTTTTTATATAPSATASPAPTAGSGGSGSGTSGLLADHVSIITGSGQGIGAAAALLFAAEGSKVVVSDIDASKSDLVAAQINSKFGADTALSVPGDVTAKDFPDRIIKATIEYGRLCESHAFKSV